MRRALTRGQTIVLVLATAPMIAVGIGGAIGTYANAASILHRSKTALGVVAAGEGATLVAALVMLGLTMLGQPAPLAIRAALWLLPAAASAMGIAIAPTFREAVVFAITPLAMTVSAEGLGLLARRIVVHHTGEDVEAQRRNAATMRRIAYLRARAEGHPNARVRKRSALYAWRLMSRVGAGDTQLGSGLITVQRDRLTAGADAALGEMLTGSPVVSPALPPAEPTEPDFDTVADGALYVASSQPNREPLLPTAGIILPALDQQLRREPGLSPAEPAPALANDPDPEPTPEPDAEPAGDPIDAQITDLAARLRRGERLTKNSAAEILGVSPATAGRRLKDARDRIGDGTGHYL